MIFQTRYTQKVFTGDYISGEMKYFQFGVWSISYNCCLEMKLIAGVISLRSFWQKWNFIPSDKILCKHYLKWNHPKGNICVCEYFIKTKIVGQKIETRITFHFISPAIAANVNNFFFHGKIKFHYEKISFRVSCKHPLLRFENCTAEFKH